MSTSLLKKLRCLHIVLLAMMLNACVAPLLLMSPQGQLMWALLKPLVGLNPNDVGLFEQPLIKDRMKSLLGDKYETTVSLLKTADKIQQEGPLFYLVSTYTPVPEMAEKAGFVWNSDTNQMAVMLLTGGSPKIISEQFTDQAEKLVPSWPKELADYTNPQKLQQKVIEAGTNQVQQQLDVSPAELNATKALATGDVKAVQDAVITTPVTEAATTITAPIVPAEITQPVIPEVKKQ